MRRGGKELIKKGEGWNRLGVWGHWGGRNRVNGGYKGLRGVGSGDSLILSLKAYGNLDQWLHVQWKAQHCTSAAAN